jgi:large subunit ribosomal protein L28
MAICASCGKKPLFGRSRSHAFNTTNRKFKPNLQTVRVLVDGKRIKKTLCTKCLKAMGKDA